MLLHPQCSQTHDTPAPAPPCPTALPLQSCAGLCGALATWGPRHPMPALLCPISHPQLVPSPTTTREEGPGSPMAGQSGVKWGKLGPYLQEGEAPLHVLHELLLLGAQGWGEEQEQQAAPGPHGRPRVQPPHQCSGMLRPLEALIESRCGRGEERLLLPRGPAPSALTPSLPGGCPHQPYVVPASCEAGAGGWGHAAGGTCRVQGVGSAAAAPCSTGRTCPLMLGTARGTAWGQAGPGAKPWARPQRWLPVHWSQRCPGQVANLSWPRPRARAGGVKPGPAPRPPAP